MKQVKGVRGFGVTAMLALAVTAGAAGGAIALTARDGGAQVVEQQQEAVRFAPAADSATLAKPTAEPSPAAAAVDAEPSTSAELSTSAAEVKSVEAPEPKSATAAQPAVSVPTRKVAAEDTVVEEAPVAKADPVDTAPALTVAPPTQRVETPVEQAHVPQHHLDKVAELAGEPAPKAPTAPGSPAS